MSEWNEDFDALVSALQEREPTPEDQRRIRAKIEAASALALGTGVLSATLGAQASTELGLTSVAPKAFLGAKLASVAATPKLVLVAAAISVGAAPVVVHLSSQSEGPPADQAFVQKDTPERLGSSQPSSGEIGSNQPSSNEMDSSENAARRTVLPPSPTDETFAARDEPPRAETGNAAAAPKVMPAQKAPAPPGETASRAEVTAAGPGHQASATLRGAEPPFAASESVPSERPTPQLEASPQLRDETALLERALGALRRGDLAAAQVYLAQHERMFPRGALSPERERTRAHIASLVGP